MLVGLLLGLTGSLGHCMGMCGPVVVLLAGRRESGGPSGGSPVDGRVLLLHGGRVTTYVILGWAAGALGGFVGPAMPGMRRVQGLLALAAAGVAVYMALGLLGRVPSAELLLAGLTRRWGDAVRRLTARGAGKGQPGTLRSFLLGLLWGFLPCGLVMTALLVAAATGTPWGGGLTMLAFGLGTWPALLGLGWLVRRRTSPAWVWPRQAAALVILLFGAQMALRGLAAWGWVGHLHLGRVMLW